MAPLRTGSKIVSTGPELSNREYPSKRSVGLKRQSQNQRPAHIGPKSVETPQQSSGPAPCAPALPMIRSVIGAGGVRRSRSRMTTLSDAALAGLAGRTQRSLHGLGYKRIDRGLDLPDSAPG